MRWLWNRFVEILDGASGGGMGPATITWADIAAWSALTGEMLEPRDVRLVMRLSNLRASIATEDGKGHGGQDED